VVVAGAVGVTAERVVLTTSLLRVMAEPLAVLALSPVVVSAAVIPNIMDSAQEEQSA